MPHRTCYLRSFFGGRPSTTSRQAACFRPTFESLEPRLTLSTYYVDGVGGDGLSGGGNNTWAGTSPATAWKTINYGLSQLNAGDTLYIRGGTYTEAGVYNNAGDVFPDGTGPSALTAICGYPGERPVWRPSSVPSGGTGVISLRNCGSYTKFDNLELDGSLLGKSNGMNTFKIFRQDEDPITGMVFTNNIVHGGSYNNVQCGSGTDHFLFEGNTIYHCGRWWNDDPDHPGPNQMYLEGDNHIIRNNVVYATAPAVGDHPKQGGIRIANNASSGVGSDNNVVENNSINFLAFPDLITSGINMGCGDNNVARNNIIVGADSGIFFWSQGTWSQNNNRAYNNTIYDCAEGIVIGTDSALTNTKATNNIIYNCGRAIHDDSNKIYDTYNLTTDPHFVHPSAFDFHLQSDSAAIDAGANLSSQGVTVDFEGNSRPYGSAYDIGAYEYQGGATSTTFYSSSTGEGYALESSETSGVGGGADASLLRIGDTVSSSQDLQAVMFVSFDTSSLPDTATITSAKLRLRKSQVNGTDPFTTHGTCLVDIDGNTGFGGNYALAASDFQAAADAAGVAQVSNASIGNWSEGTLVSSGMSWINKTGMTQFRVRFSLDDNDDIGADYAYFSKTSDGQGYQPELVVEHTIAAPVDVTWTGASSSTWSTVAGSSNWKNTSDGTAADYFDGVNVLFGDTAVGTNVTISAADVTPATVTFNNTSKSFSVSGTKGIAGASTTVKKQGTGTATIGSVNSYGGVTTVEAGRLVLQGAAKAMPPVLSGAGVNLKAGMLVLDYAGESSPTSTVKSLLTTSYIGSGGSHFNTGKFQSTTADATHGLGWTDNTATSKISIAYTIYGDTDLDGSVGLSDLGRVLTNWGTGTTWAQGDVDYDGVVGLADLGKVLTNWGLTVGTLVPAGSSGTVVLATIASATPTAQSSIEVASKTTRPLAAAATPAATRILRRNVPLQQAARSRAAVVDRIDLAALAACELQRRYESTISASVDEENFGRAWTRPRLGQRM